MSAYLHGSVVMQVKGSIDRSKSIGVTDEDVYEPSGSVHRVAQNPSRKSETRLLAVILHPRDAKQVTVREKDKE